MAQDEALGKIKELVKKFEVNEAEYKQTKYNEASAIRDFIDPFFEALGWDTSNKGRAVTIQKRSRKV